MRVAGGPYIPVRRIEDMAAPPLPGTPGPAVPVRVYLPSLAPASRLPLVLFSHGGGWVVGSVASYDQCCRRLAVMGQAVVVSVDYRRGPEHQYPAALDDVEAAYHWAVTTLAQHHYPQARKASQPWPSGVRET